MKYREKTDAFIRRTAILGENIIELGKNIKPDYINKPIINQMIRSGTSIGANYCEAINASSKRDFRNKIFICKKETQEKLSIGFKCYQNVILKQRIEREYIGRTAKNLS